MKYYTYWSILDAPSNAIKTFDVCFVIMIISFVLWVIVKKFMKNNNDYEKTILLWFSGFLFTISLITFVYFKFFTRDDREIELIKILTSDKVGKVEGKMFNFNREIVTKRYGSTTYESFCVDSLTFNYSSNLLASFNDFGKTNNMIFYDGLQVRITYSRDDNKILKIEIGE